MSALKTALWTGASVAAGIAAFSGAPIIGGAIALFSAFKAWGSHKESQHDSAMHAAHHVHGNFVAQDRARERAMAIQQAYGDRDTAVGWAAAEDGRGVGARVR